MPPISRVGRLEDIASMVLFLASDESELVDRASDIVDGGLTVGPNFSALSGAAPATRAACLHWTVVQEMSQGGEVYSAQAILGDIYNWFTR